MTAIGAGAVGTQPAADRPVFGGTSVADLAGAAAELVSKGCQPRLRPFNDVRYAELLDRYRTQDSFRDIVDAVAQGFGLVLVAAHDREGLMLAPGPGSIFSLRLTDLRLSVEERMLQGLIHVAIAARVYPTPADLDSEDVRRTSVSDIDRFIRQVCESLRKESTDTAGLDLGQDLDSAWRAYEAMPPVRYSESKARKAHLVKSSSQYWVKVVLEWLVAQGYAGAATELGDGSYRLFHRFRLQVREAAGTPTMESLAAFARKFEAEGRLAQPAATAGLPPVPDPAGATDETAGSEEA